MTDRPYRQERVAEEHILAQQTPDKGFGILKRGDFPGAAVQPEVIPAGLRQFDEKEP